jgi:hypothetical protein
MIEMLSSSENDGLSSMALPIPYKGLVSYTEVDGDYFFGRDSARDLVTAYLMARSLTVLYGPSGVGKSSLLQAAVMRHLRRIPEGVFSYLAVRDPIIVYDSSWRNDSVAELGEALVRAAPVHDSIKPTFQAPQPLSVELLRKLTEPPNSYVYLLLDQFEEQALYQAGQHHLFGD